MNHASLAIGNHASARALPAEAAALRLGADNGTRF